MNLIVRITLLLTIFLWLIGSIIPIVPVLNENSIEVFPLLYIVYSPVCHQDINKLLCNNDGCSFLCTRCIGIYFGVFIMSLVTVTVNYFKNIHIKYFFISSIPLIMDVVFVSVGLYNYSKTIAFITGMIFGTAAFYYFYSGIEMVFVKRKDS